MTFKHFRAQIMQAPGSFYLSQLLTELFDIISSYNYLNFGNMHLKPLLLKNIFQLLFHITSFFYQFHHF